MRHIAWLGLFVLACSATTEGGHEAAKSEQAGPSPSEPDAKNDTTKPDASKPDASKPDATKPDASKPDATKTDAAEPAAVEPAKPEPVDPNTVAPYYFVQFGAAAPTVLVRSWGWGCMSNAERSACEANAPTVGAMMACGTRDKPKHASKLVRSLGLRLGQTKPVEREQIADWAPTPPPELWLIGSDSACKAKVGRPLVSVYSVDPDEPRLDLRDEFTILELAWELSGCELGQGKWSPLALPAFPGDEAPAAMRWHPAEIGARERIDPATWKGGLAGMLPALQARATEWIAGMGAPAGSTPEWWTQAATIPGTKVGERHFAVLWRREPADPAKPDAYPCGTEEFGVTIRTRDDASELRRHDADATKCDPADDECEDEDEDDVFDVGELVGALAREGKVEHLVWSDSLDYAAAPLAGERLGEPIDVKTGGHHPESGGTASYAVVPYCGP